MTLSDDLNMVADQIEQRGWAQGAYQSDEAVCLLGGINLALGATPADEYNLVVCPRAHAIQSAVADYLDIADGGDDSEWLYVWNDEEGRTAQEVIQTLRDVALKHQPDAYHSEVS